MATRPSFAPDEWYHCFNRGIDKRTVFNDRADHERFLQLLYLSNSDRPIHRSDLYRRTTEEVLNIPRGKPLVDIGAFCLMPNHFHLLLNETAKDGISSFMQKLGTAYTMYFNKRHGRSGNLFMKPFRSRHVGEDEYFQHLLHYIHCNPAELYEHSWKKGVVRDTRALEKKLLAYRYSSLGAFYSNDHTLRAILSPTVFEISRHDPLSKMLKDARSYYDEISSTHVKATP